MIYGPTLAGPLCGLRQQSCKLKFQFWALVRQWLSEVKWTELYATFWQDIDVPEVLFFYFTYVAPFRV